MLQDFCLSSGAVGPVGSLPRNKRKFFAEVGGGEGEVSRHQNKKKRHSCFHFLYLYLATKY